MLPQKTILLVHGRSWKPSISEWKQLWMEALRFGVLTDFPALKKDWDKVRFEYVYYGDLSNQYLEKIGRTPPPPDDLADRWVSLEELKRRSRVAFTRQAYRCLPNRRSWMELLADSVGAMANVLRVGQPLIEAFAPDMDQYWNPDEEFGEYVRGRMIAPLKRAMRREGDILVIAHSLGALVAYDTFWKFSHTAEYMPRYAERKVHTWLTLGSPLGDETVKRNLRGARASGPRKYPHNVRRWVNVSAEDDYVSHDGNVRNDYRGMLTCKCIESIKDIPIYNLAVRQGMANPHNSEGYLIHPKVTAVVAAFLKA
ncbi:MAG: hypothetical protein EOM20_20850 [Spartobacteria bacterium]|nr:hypothetical protein [Spartobacteria bacterium]